MAKPIRKNPFEDDNAQEEQLERSVKSIKDEVAKEEDLEIEVDDEEGDDEDEDEQQVATAPKPTRRERRETRLRDYRQLEEERERLRAENEQMRGVFQGLQWAGQQQPQQMPQQQQQPTLLDRELTNVRRERENLYNEYEARKARGQVTPEYAEQVKTRAYQLQDEEARLNAERFSQRQQPVQQQPTQHPVDAMLASEYPDVYGNQAQMAFALARRVQIVAAEGANPVDLQVLRRALNETREHFGGNGRQRRPAPTQATRERSSGVSRGPSNAGPEPIRVVKMDDHRRRMARTMYPDDPPGEAYKKWAKRVGVGLERELAEKRRERRA